MALSPEQLLKLTQQKIKENVNADNDNDVGPTTGELNAIMVKIENILKRFMNGRGDPEGGVIGRIQTVVNKANDKVQKALEPMLTRIEENLAGGQLATASPNANQQTINASVLVSSEKQNIKNFEEIFKSIFKQNTEIAELFRKNNAASIKSTLTGQFFQNVFSKVKSFSFLKDGVNVIKTTIKSMSSSLVGFVKSFGPVLQNVKTFAVNIFNKIGSVISSLANIQSSIGVVIKNIGKVTAQLTKRFFAFLILTILPVIIGIFGSIIGFVIPLLGTIFSFVVFTILPAIFSVIAFIITAVIPSLIAILIPVTIVFAKVLIIFSLIVLVFLAVWLIFNFFKDLFTVGFDQAIKNVFENWEGFWQLIEGVMTDVISGIESLLGIEEGKLREYFSDAIGWIMELIQNTRSAISLFDEQYTRITDFWRGVWEDFKAWWMRTLVEPLAEFLMWVWDGLKPVIIWAWEAMKPIISWIGRAFRFAWEAFKVGFQEFVNIIIRGINFLIGAINRILGFAFSFSIFGREISIGPITDYRIPTLEELEIDYSGLEAAATELATGGIVTSATFGLIGEGNASEAVIPLNEQGLSFLAEAIGTSAAFSETLNTNNTIRLQNSDMENMTALISQQMSSLSQEEREKVLQSMSLGLTSFDREENTKVTAMGHSYFEAISEIEKMTHDIQSENNNSLSQIGSKLQEINTKLESVHTATTTNRNQGGSVSVHNNTQAVDRYVDMIAKGMLEGD